MTSSSVEKQLQFHLLPLNQSQAEPLPERPVFVHARLTASVPWTEVRADQWEAVGLYEVWVPGCLTHSQAASCAMSAFRTEIATELSCLDFQIVDGITGKSMRCDPRLPPGALADAFTSIKLVGHLG